MLTWVLSTFALMLCWILLPEPLHEHTCTQSNTLPGKHSFGEDPQCSLYFLQVIHSSFSCSLAWLCLLAWHPQRGGPSFSGNSPTLETREGTELGYLHPTSEDPGLRESVVSWHQVLEKPSGIWKLVGASGVGDPWLWWGQWSWGGRHCKGVVTLILNVLHRPPLGGGPVRWLVPVLPLLDAQLGRLAVSFLKPQLLRANHPGKSGVLPGPRPLWADHLREVLRERWSGKTACPWGPTSLPLRCFYTASGHLRKDPSGPRISRARISRDVCLKQQGPTGRWQGVQGRGDLRRLSQRGETK